ncbi:MAG TPA: DinB family protein [Chloroflexia bacterium]|nr:DinB family protein [Chloroflexia bacterium]
MIQPLASEGSLVAQFFHHNTWANLRLLDALANLNDEQFDTNAVGTMGTVRETIVHIIGAETRYLASLTGQPRPEALERQPFPGIDDLRERAQRTGEGLAQVAARSTPQDTIETQWQGVTAYLKVSTVLIQAINHGAEHRAHIATILTQLGIEPPGMDGWAYNTYIEGSMPG